MASILVTGTNVGIGFGIVEQLVKRSDVEHIFATVRNPSSPASTEINKLAKTSPKIHVIPLVLTEESAAAAAKEVSKVAGSLDILINNIGIGQDPQHPAETSVALLREEFEVNVIGPHIVTVAMLPLLKKGNKKIIVNISTIVASITYNDGRFPWMCPAYGASKAALNFLTTDYAKDLGPEGFIVVPLYPGWVATRSAPGATMPVEESATGVVKVVFGLTSKDNGKFIAVLDPITVLT